MVFNLIFYCVTVQAKNTRVRDIRTFAVLFSAYWPFAWQSLTPLWFAVLCLFFAGLVLSLLCVGFQFVGQSLKFSVSMFQVDTWKPQAGGHVTGLWRRFVSGRNDVLLPLSTGVLSLPLAALFLFFSRAVFCAARWLTERLEEVRKKVKVNSA